MIPPKGPIFVRSITFVTSIVMVLLPSLHELLESALPSSDFVILHQTNNPRKIEVLESLGVKVTKRIPCIVTAQKHNLGYLNAKQTRMRHMLSQEPVLDGAYCIWNHEGEVLSSPRKGPLSDLIDERELRTERRPELKEVERSIDGDSIEGQ